MKRVCMCVFPFGVAFVLLQSNALAGVITNGSYSVGIGPHGELFDYPSYIGFQRIADGLDPLAPGYPRDSWSISANFSSAWADYQYYGSSGVSSNSNYTAYYSNSAVVATYTSLDLLVLQAYSFVAPNILMIDTTVQNVGSSTAGNLLFQRDVDWDFYPTLFNETSYCPPISWPTTRNVIDSSYYGFENPDLMVEYGSSCAAGGTHIGDMGGGIELWLGGGSLAPGASTSFIYFYGVSSVGQTPADLISEAQGLGAYYYVATYSSDGDLDHATSSALIAVATPEPGTGAILLIGVGMIAAGLKRRRRAR